MSEQNFKQIIQDTRVVIHAFEKVEQREWGIEGNMIELSKQVGELARNVMMLEKYYLADRKKEAKYNKASKKEVGNELSDIFFMLVRIADYYKVDLEQVHFEELKKAKKSLEI